MCIYFWMPLLKEAIGQCIILFFFLWLLLLSLGLKAILMLCCLAVQI